jgi:hypothetical protein
MASTFYRQISIKNFDYPNTPPSDKHVKATQLKITGDISYMLVQLYVSRFIKKRRKVFLNFKNSFIIIPRKKQTLRSVETRRYCLHSLVCI